MSMQNAITSKPQYVSTASEILALKVTEVQTLIAKLLPQKGLSALSGSSDAGKSFLALFIAIYICGSEPEIFGLKINRANGSVIIVCTEDSAEDICVRLSGFLKTYKIDEQKLRFIFETDDLPAKLKKELTRQPADLVVMDTFGDLFTKNINDSIAIRHFLKEYKKLSNDFKCQILINHHIGKGKENNTSPSKNDVLGSQGIESVCRTVLNLRKRADGKRVLTVVKGNHIAEEYKNKGLVLSFDIEKGFEPTGESMNFSGSQSEPSNNKVLIEEVLIMYPLLKSYQKVASALKKKGFKKIDKNKVGKIWKEFGPSDPPPTENDGRMGDE